jgi:hypothetical protein
MKSILFLAIAIQAVSSTDAVAQARYDKGFILESPDGQFLMKTGVRAQLRVESRKPIDGGEFTSAFMIPRLRLQLEGHAYGQSNLYKLEFEMANRGFALLRDFYYEHAFAPAVRLRIGQWKRPFNRQEMTADFGSEFLERAITTEFIGSGRDQGIALHNDLEKSPEGIEWAVGVFNAGSDRPRFTTTIDCEDPADASTCTVTPAAPTTVPADLGPMLVARAGFNHGGIKGYSDGDLEGGPFRYAVGAGYQVNLGDLTADSQRHAAEIDALIKVEGISVLASGFVRKNGPADAQFGGLLQPGYMVVPRTYQLSARFAGHEEGDEWRIEMLGAFSWFFQGHSHKWQTDAGVVHTTGVKDAGLQIRSQLQFVF